MWGTRDLHFYQPKQIKRVRVVRRADRHEDGARRIREELAWEYSAPVLLAAYERLSA